MTEENPYYEHPTLQPFFNRDLDNGVRNEKLYVLSPHDGVFVTTSVFSSHTEYRCQQALIPSFPGASPYNHTLHGEASVFRDVDDVTDYVDVVGERVMLEVETLDGLFEVEEL